MLSSNSARWREPISAPDGERLQCEGCPYEVTRSGAFGCSRLFCPARSAFRRQQREHGSPSGTAGTRHGLTSSADGGSSLIASSSYSEGSSSIACPLRGRRWVSHRESTPE
jgi:hypothetical protein